MPANAGKRAQQARSRKWGKSAQYAATSEASPRPHFRARRRGVDSGELGPKPQAQVNQLQFASRFLLVNLRADERGTIGRLVVIATVFTATNRFDCPRAAVLVVNPLQLWSRRGTRTEKAGAQRRSSDIKLRMCFLITKTEHIRAVRAPMDSKTCRLNGNPALLVLELLKLHQVHLGPRIRGVEFQGSLKGLLCLDQLALLR